MFSPRLRAFTLLSCACLLLVACGSKTESTKSEPTAQTKPAAPVLTEAQKAELSRRLDIADGVDGAKDKVVSKCASCALHMAGKPANELEVEGYKMHFCSAGCRDGFAKSPATSVLEMKLPES